MISSYDGLDNPVPNNDVLTALSDQKIFDVESVENGKYLLFIERCDDYWNAKLTKPEVLRLADQLREMADKMKD